MQLLFAGFTKSVILRSAENEKQMREQAQKGTPAVPALKEFRPKMGLPKLNNYGRSPHAGYWNHWPKRTFEQQLPTKSWVSSTKLMELANHIVIQTEQGWKG